MRILVLGPQRRPTLRSVVRTLDAPERFATVTAGWEEREPDDAELDALLRGAGLADVAIREIGFSYTVSDLDELWDGVRTGSVRTAAQLRALDDDERDRVRGALEELLEQRRSSGGLELETAVKIAVGVSSAG